MKKKAFTLIELMIVMLIVGIVVAVGIPIIRAKINAAKDVELKMGYFSSEQFNQIVGYPNQVQKAKDVVNRFQEYMYGNLHLASVEDIENYLKRSKVEDPGFDERVLDGLLKFKESYKNPVIKGVKK